MSSHYTSSKGGSRPKICYDTEQEAWGARDVAITLSNHVHEFEVYACAGHWHIGRKSPDWPEGYYSHHQHDRYTEALVGILVGILRGTYRGHPNDPLTKRIELGEVQK